MASFRLLQISDLHVSVPPDNIDLGSVSIWLSTQALYPSRARRRNVLEALADLATQLRNSIDIVILSGDLADDGERRNLETARDFIELPQMAPGVPFTADGFPTLGYSSRSDQRTLFVMPGNHDRFSGMGRFPGGTEFDDVFGAYWRSGICGIQALAISRSNETLVLIAADFCLRAMRNAPLSAWGQGLADARTIEALVNKTNAVRDVYRQPGVIWVLHFPPILDVERELRLRNSGAVIEAAHSSRVSHVIAGHLHRTQSVDYANLEVCCIGSAASELRATYGNWMQLLEVDVVSGSVSVEYQKYRYVTDKNRFQLEA